MSEQETTPLPRQALELLYAKYNHRKYVSPDPLEFVYLYENPQDREIVGMIAASLAFGNVKQIRRSVSAVTQHMARPRRFLEDSTKNSLRKTFAGFRHRYCDDEDLVDLLLGMKQAVERFGDLRECFAQGLNPDDETVLPALTRFVEELRHKSTGGHNTLLPSPTLGSACKRLNLFLRWMIRRDDVDPGGWDTFPASKLIIPLDTHMYRIGRHLGLTARKQANMRTALEVTAGFRACSPDDPVRYDFALTRLGIRQDADLDAFLRECRAAPLG